MAERVGHESARILSLPLYANFTTRYCPWVVRAKGAVQWSGRICSS